MADNRAYGLEDELYDIIESADDIVDQDVDDVLDAEEDLMNDIDGQMIDSVSGDTDEDDNPYYVYEEE